MKKIFKNIVVNILSYESRKVLKKYNPKIIAVTGNIGKTTSKDYIYNFLKFKLRENVRASEKSQNSEFGLNLTILGEKNAWNNPLAWFYIIIKNLFGLFFTSFYPKTLVLEVGADKPGDIKFLARIFSPDIAVLTAFQKSPTHGEFFLNIDQHILEKKFLVDALKDGGTIVYNADDEVMSQLAQGKLAESKNTKIVSFGFGDTSNVRIVSYENIYDQEGQINGISANFSISLENNNYKLTLEFLGVLGVAHLYSIASSICVSLLEGMSITEVENAVHEFDKENSLSKSRMRILKGVNNSIIVDDSYNSSPKAAENAIETIREIKSVGKRIAILGHMAELGDRTKVEHFNIGFLASQSFDIIVLSGRYNEYFLEGIRENKFDLSKVFLANNSSEVIDLISKNNLIGNNDLILVKGSQSARLEKVVINLLRDKEDKSKVCRQDTEWEKR